MKIRPLALKHPLAPDNAPLFARDIVASTARITGDVLDYSPGSLAVVDRILEGMGGQGVTVDKVAETLFGFGCYAGEVFVHHAGGRWIKTPEQWLAAVGMRIASSCRRGSPVQPDLQGVQAAGIWGGGFPRLLLRRL